jgi:hypothetical protein
MDKEAAKLRRELVFEARAVPVRVAQPLLVPPPDGARAGRIWVDTPSSRVKALAFRKPVGAAFCAAGLHGGNDAISLFVRSTARNSNALC